MQFPSLSQFHATTTYEVRPYYFQPAHVQSSTWFPAPHIPSSRYALHFFDVQMLFTFLISKPSHFNFLLHTILTHHLLAQYNISSTPLTSSFESPSCFLKKLYSDFTTVHSGSVLNSATFQNIPLKITYPIHHPN